MVDLAAHHEPFTCEFGGVHHCPCPEDHSGEEKDEHDEQDEEDEDNFRDSKETRTGGGGKVREVTLEKLRARLQVPPIGPFDRTDIAWEGRTNQSRGRYRETFRAIIPWDRLGDFVEGEQSMRDFPCTFDEVPTVGHKEGAAINAKETSFLQKIK